MRIADDDRGSGRLDQIAEVSPRKAAAQGPNDRGGEDDVADQAKPDEQDFHSGSMVASSISMTGMSSLIGYTR